MKYNIIGSKISSVVAFFLLISKTGGVGIMIIPYAMQHSGIILISLFLVVIAVILIYSQHLLLEIIKLKNLDHPELPIIFSRALNQNK